MKIKISPIALFSAILVLCMLMVAGNKLFHSPTSLKKEYQYLSLVAEVTSLVRSEYVEEIKPEAKFPGAFSAMLASLDNVSAYLDPNETALYNLYIQEKTYHTGIYGSKVDDYFQVTDVLKHSPAEAAGLKEGDFLKAINGHSIYGLNYWEMALALVSPTPSQVEVIVFKENTAQPVKMSIKTLLHPSQEDTPPVTEQVRPTILRVNLPRVNSAAVAALKQALTPTTTPPIHLILDLRKYRGGDWESVVQLSRLLFPKEITVTLKQKEKEESIVLGTNHVPAYRVAIIINPSTLLYGELLAVLFKAANPAITLIGSQTSGLISQLSHIPLTDGSSILLTTGQFRLAGDKPVDKGITPDIRLNAQEFGTVIERCISILATPPAPPDEQNHERHQAKN